jgi:Rod binding domain-containing protein
MKVGPLHPTSTFGLDPNADAKKIEKKSEPGAVDPKSGIDPEKLRLAREFEQIFLRKMLASLEKSGQQKAGASASAGGSAYGSMVVSALAEAVSKGGGFGLAEMIAKSASQPLASGPTTSTGATAAIQSAIANATSPLPLGQIGGAGAARMTAPENVRITAPHPPTSASQSPTAPGTLLNENNDIHDLFKDPNR